MPNNPTYEEAADRSDLLAMVSGQRARAKKRRAKKKPSKLVGSGRLVRPLRTIEVLANEALCQLSDITPESRNVRKVIMRISRLAYNAVNAAARPNTQTQTGGATPPPKGTQ